MRSLRTYAIAALAVGVLATGCSSADVHPGQAAVVEGNAISMKTANSFADDFCDLNKPSLQQNKLTFPMVTLRALSLNILVQDELLHRYADERGWTPPASYRQAIGGLDDEAKQANVPGLFRPSTAGPRGETPLPQYEVQSWSWRPAGNQLA